jgi:hypothetical protein
MKITLSPMRGDAPVMLEKSADVLVVNGERFDFGPVGEGDVLPRDAVSGNWLASDVTRRNGTLHLAVVLPHGRCAPSETRFPAPVHVTQDGPVPLPPFGEAK